jgi:hypothetical protein
VHQTDTVDGVEPRLRLDRHRAQVGQLGVAPPSEAGLVRLQPAGQPVRRECADPELAVLEAARRQHRHATEPADQLADLVPEAGQSGLVEVGDDQVTADTGEVRRHQQGRLVGRFVPTTDLEHLGHR